jgi:hypothetical protein
MQTIPIRSAGVERWRLNEFYRFWKFGFKGRGRFFWVGGWGRFFYRGIKYQTKQKWY